METKIFIITKVIPPPFSYFENGGGARRAEGGRMSRPLRSNPKTMHRAIELRKESTPAEAKLWDYIRNDQPSVNFRRQHAIGNYIPDFVCIQKKLIIELDGSRHLEQKEYDDERTKYFESLGYRVIRFWNNQIMNDINGVIKAIQFALEGKIQVWKNSKG
jgi:very-short-patch-repair endonuclease